MKEFKFEILAILIGIAMIGWSLYIAAPIIGKYW